MESFETDPKNQILAKFGQNDGLIWPILGQILEKKNQIGSILHQKVVFLTYGIFDPNLAIWLFGQMGFSPNFSEVLLNV